MKRVALALIVAALVWAPSASAADRCSAPRATTVVENTQARVFVVKGKGEVKRRFYGCVRGQKPRLLATSIQEKTIDPTSTSNKRFHLSGRFVAWVREVYTDFGAGEFGRSIEERPLEPGHRSVTQDVTEYREVGALRLRADGALAWILVTTGPYREVDAVESDATEATPLAYSRGVNPPFVLRFDETSVHWSEDGVDRNAPVR